MAFTKPSFNRPYQLWLTGNFPPSAPDWAASCQLYVAPRPFVPVFKPSPTPGVPDIYIRVDNDLYNLLATPFTDALFEVQDVWGFGWYYLVMWWEYVHQGFPNEYIQLAVFQCDQLRTVPDPNR